MKPIAVKKVSLFGQCYPQSIMQHYMRPRMDHQLVRTKTLRFADALTDIRRV